MHEADRPVRISDGIDAVRTEAQPTGGGLTDLVPKSEREIFSTRPAQEPGARGTVASRPDSGLVTGSVGAVRAGAVRPTRPWRLPTSDTSQHRSVVACRVHVLTYWDSCTFAGERGKGTVSAKPRKRYLHGRQISSSNASQFPASSGSPQSRQNGPGTSRSPNLGTMWFIAVSCARVLPVEGSM